MQLHVDMPDDQNIAFEFDLADCFRDQPVIRRIDLTRFQRASEGARQSTRCGCNDVIERRRVRFQRFGRNLVVLGNGAVHTEDHRLWFGWQIRSPNRAFHAFDAYVRAVCDGGHIHPLVIGTFSA
jgi:hypothetical protein